MTWRVIASAISIICLTMSIANAETRVFARAGGWEAFGGTSNNGRAVCGISTKGTGKYFGLKYFSGGDTFTIQLGSSAWRIKNGDKQKVMLQFDRESPWNGVATGMHFSDGEAGLEFNVRRNQLDKFMREFRDASELMIKFPQSTASGWRANLKGTDTITTSLAQCIRALRS